MMRFPVRGRTPTKINSWLVAAILFFAQAVVVVHAEEPPFVRPFDYEAANRKLAEVLQDFGASQSVPVIIADGVEGIVTGRFKLSPGSFLRLMTGTYGLTWYYDGSALYVYPLKSLQSRMVRLRDVQFPVLQRQLESLQLADARFPMRYSPESAVLYLHGPPRFIEVVSSLVDILSEQGREPQRPTLKIYSLAHASAADLNVGGINIPGVASLLTRIYGEEASTADNREARAALLPKQWPTYAPALYGTESPELAQQRLQKTTERTLDSLENTLTSGAQGSSGGGNASLIKAAANGIPKPSFHADASGNAVVVRAAASQLPEIEALIRQLDVKPEMIELEAMIIDVSSDDLRDLGIEWQIADDRSKLAYSSPYGPETKGPQFSLTRLSASGVLQFLARVNALEMSGRIQVVARPRVAGLINRSATMKDSRVASVRVAGHLSANLFQVEISTRIEVVPRRARNSPEAPVLLAITIEDGAFDTAVVDAIPVVKKTEIHTEAYVSENGALLIGGISSSHRSDSESEVPGLSRIPLLGALFSNSQSYGSRRERLFWIRPRTVSVESPAALAAWENSGQAALNKTSGMLNKSDKENGNE